MRLGRTRAIAVLVGVASIAAACAGDDSSSNSSSGATTGQTAASPAASSTTVAPSTTGPATQPQSMDDWSKLWASQRAAVVKRIKDGHYGLSADGKTVTGPGEFKIDMSKCPTGWSNTEGLTDTEIKIGHTTAQSGTLADYGNIARGMDVLWAYQNDQGGFRDSTG